MRDRQSYPCRDDNYFMADMIVLVNADAYKFVDIFRWHYDNSHRRRHCREKLKACRLQLIKLKLSTATKLVGSLVAVVFYVHSDYDCSQHNTDNTND